MLLFWSVSVGSLVSFYDIMQMLCHDRRFAGYRVSGISALGPFFYVGDPLSPHPSPGYATLH